jgi:hypothetical protein
MNLQRYKLELDEDGRPCKDEFGIPIYKNERGEEEVVDVNKLFARIKEVNRESKSRKKVIKELNEDFSKMQKLLRGV